VKRVDLCAAFGLEPNRAAIGFRRWLAVCGLSNAKGACAQLAVKTAVTFSAALNPERAKGWRIKCLRGLNVIRPDHYVCEHGFLLLKLFPKVSF
jgi:hypothetical protein